MCREAWAGPGAGQTASGGGGPEEETGGGQAGDRGLQEAAGAADVSLTPHSCVGDIERTADVSCCLVFPPSKAEAVGAETKLLSLFIW